jgi:ferredoxin
MKNTLLLKRLRIILASLSLIITSICFVVESSVLHFIIFLQLIPAIVKLFASFSLATLSAVFMVLLFTFIFGRFYCSIVCPLGILQDVINFFSPAKKSLQIYNFKMTRYIIATISFSLLISGFAYAFLLIDPYSIFGRINATIFNHLIVFTHNLIVPSNYINYHVVDVKSTLLGTLPLIILIILVVSKKRLLCNAICPAGTLLGLCSKNGFFKLTIDKTTCIACGNCQKSCPCGAIDIKNNKSLNNETCIRCMNCKAICPVNAINYSYNKKECAPIKTDLSKRDFITLVACALISFGAGLTLKTKSKPNSKKQNVILPPGAGSYQRFESKCTQCLLCVTNCQGNVLSFGDTSSGVHLDFSKGFCEYNCNNCSKVCPTGAIEKMTLEQKKLCRIGIADLTISRCVTVTDNTECGACAEQCPTGALQMKLAATTGVRVPYFINHELCIGCGACHNACPVKPKTAIFVNPITLQLKAENPVNLDKNKQNDIESNQSLETSNKWSF